MRGFRKLLNVSPATFVTEMSQLKYFRVDSWKSLEVQRLFASDGNKLLMKLVNHGM